jgi:hypothetical protein
MVAKTLLPLVQYVTKFKEIPHSIAVFFYWHFYFRALGSLVVLSFPQHLSFSSVLSKPLVETVTSAGKAGCPMVEHF